MKIVVGLGNPGVKYKDTRHNIGFMVVDEVAKEHNAAFKRSFFCDCHIAKIKIRNENILLVKPVTFMNNSGVCVRKVIAHYKIAPENLLVVYDDADLNPGALRFRKNGSSGGHQGLASIILNLKTENILRLKVGVGKPENEDLADYVLSDFDTSEKEIIKDAIQKASLACVGWVNSGSDYVMSNYNKQ